MACPEPEVLSGLVEDTLAPDARHTIEAHLDDCEECRRTVALLARSHVAERPSRPSGVGLADTEVDTVGAGRRARRVLAPGARVGRYVIRDVIGKGGMGIVYAAEDPELHRELAIKVLRHDFASAQPDAARRIVREAQAMAKIAHPNVVTVFDVGTFEDQVFIAMERVRGGNLRTWVAKQDSISAIVDAFVAAGRGLVAAHDAGIVHRDFKPDNVLVDEAGRVRVTDFGIALDEATDLSPSVDDPTASQSIPIAGTPAYMAPEQHAGGNLDPRTDQFSFCVALYEALYDRRPFAGRTITELAVAIDAGRVAAAPPGARVPATLREIVLRGLARTPGDRFPTMDALLRALGRDRGRRPRQIAKGAAIVLLAVVVGLAADWVARGRADAITRTSFGAARAQLGRSFELRIENFKGQSELVTNLRVIQQVIDNRDEAEFGLGTPDHDREKLLHLHEALASADWLGFASASKEGEFAIADYKARLLFASADREHWGTTVDAAPIAAIYDAGGKVALGVLRADDPSVVRSGILGAGKPGLQVAFGRAVMINGQPRALYLQMIEAAKLLDEVRLGEGTELALVGPGGAFVGKLPEAVVARGRGSDPDQIEEVSAVGASWLVQRYPLDGPQGPVADIVVARETDALLGGLFPHARGVLAGGAIALLGVVIAGFAVARRRDLTRRIRA